MSEPTRYYLYIPVWATGRAPQGGGSSDYSTPTPQSSSEYETPVSSTPSSNPESYSTTGDEIFTTGPSGTPTLTFYTTDAFTSDSGTPDSTAPSSTDDPTPSAPRGGGSTDDPSGGSSAASSAGSSGSVPTDTDPTFSMSSGDSSMPSTDDPGSS